MWKVFATEEEETKTKTLSFPPIPLGAERGRIETTYTYGVENQKTV